MWKKVKEFQTKRNVTFKKMPQTIKLSTKIKSWRHRERTSSRSLWASWNRKTKRATNCHKHRFHSWVAPSAPSCCVCKRSACGDVPVGASGGQQVLVGVELDDVDGGGVRFEFRDGFPLSQVPQLMETRGQGWGHRTGREQSSPPSANQNERFYYRMLPVWCFHSIYRINTSCSHF